MKLISIFSVGVATVGMTCLVGYASAADSEPGSLISGSMLVAQGTPSPGGRGGGAAGEVGRADKGTPREKKKLGMGKANKTMSEKAKPGSKKDTGTEGNTGSDSGKTGMNSESPGSSSGAGSGTN